MNQGCLTDPAELNRILSRAVTLAQATVSPTMEDDLRMIGKVRPNFIGRAAYRWLHDETDTQHFTAAADWADRAHAVDPQLVLQACLFEAVYPPIDDIPIPAWVFDDLGHDLEERNFSWQAMIGSVEIPGQGTGTTWHGGGVPDITLPESQRWFYYLAVRYLQAGYEALHLGQAHLIAGTDAGYRQFTPNCAS